MALIRERECACDNSAGTVVIKTLVGASIGTGSYAEDTEDKGDD